MLDVLRAERATFTLLLQRFFEDSPAYFMATSGEPAGPDETLDEITGEVSADVSFMRKWVIGYVGHDGSLVAMVNVITDLLAVSVHHIGRSSCNGTAWRRARPHPLPGTGAPGRRRRM